MAKLVLHMGTHKTATTTLQDSFFANRAQLTDHGVVYPALGCHTGHHGVLTDWVALPAVYQLPKGGIGTLKALAAEHVDSDVTLLLSSEEFSRAGGQGGRVDMAALRAIFAGFEEIKVICCLRPQWQFLQSVYLEIARDRRPPSPPEIVEAALGTGQIDGLWCEYGALYDHLRMGFDPDQIEFLDFGQMQGHLGGVVGAFLAKIGMGSVTFDHVNLGHERSNVSPRPLPTWAALALLHDGVAPEGDNGLALVAALATAMDLEYGAGRPSTIFTRNEQAKLDAHFAPLNVALSARISCDQDRPALNRAPVADDALYREDLSGAFWVRAARRIYMMHNS